MADQTQSWARDELTQLRKQVEKLQDEKQMQRDEVLALKTEAKSYKDELETMNAEVQNLERQIFQDSAITKIGKEVRLRYLEQHRLRMGKGIGKLGHERIKSGDRAAHRGRPVADAFVCLTGLITDHKVYSDLYGLSPETIKQWRDVSEMVAITGFRASLKSEGRLTKEFQMHFERVLEIVKRYPSSADLSTAFSENKTLQQLQDKLQDCYDKIVAANTRGRPDSSSQQSL